MGGKEFYFLCSHLIIIHEYDIPSSSMSLIYVLISYSLRPILTKFLSYFTFIKEKMYKGKREKKNGFECPYQLLVYSSLS